MKLKITDLSFGFSSSLNTWTVSVFDEQAWNDVKILIQQKNKNIC